MNGWHKQKSYIELAAICRCQIIFIWTAKLNGKLLIVLFADSLLQSMRFFSWFSIIRRRIIKNKFRHVEDWFKYFMIISGDKIFHPYYDLYKLPQIPTNCRNAQRNHMCCSIKHTIDKFCREWQKCFLSFFKKNFVDSNLKPVHWRHIF